MINPHMFYVCRKGNSITATLKEKNKYGNTIWSRTAWLPMTVYPISRRIKRIDKVIIKCLPFRDRRNKIYE